MAASVNDNLDQTTSSATGRPVTATLSAPGHSIGGTSIGVSVATNWSTTTGIHFSIYATTTVGSLTVKDTSTQTDWKGTLSGTTISNMTITGGTDQDYSAGAIVEITPTARWAKDLYDWAIAQHKQDGTHANTITTDTINENTAANGVTIDGLNIKDSAITTASSVPSEALNCTVAFHAYRNGAWSFDGSNQTKVQLETELYDAGSDFDATTNYRFNAPVNGFYFFSARSGGDSTSRRGQASLFVNGSIRIAGDSQVTTYVGASVSGILKLAANDYVELYFQSDATDSGATGSDACYMTGALIGRY